MNINKLLERKGEQMNTQLSILVKDENSCNDKKNKPPAMHNIINLKINA